MENDQLDAMNHDIKCAISVYLKLDEDSVSKECVQDKVIIQMCSECESVIEGSDDCVACSICGNSLHQTCVSSNCTYMIDQLVCNKCNILSDNDTPKMGNDANNNVSLVPIENETRSSAAVQPPTINVSQSPASESHVITQSTSASICNELLCFIQNKLHSLPVDTLVKLTVDFYHGSQVD